MPNIAIVWDFDGTLTPDDSTTKTIEFFKEYEEGSEFWKYVKSLRGDDEQPEWEHVLASDAPIWMYSLSRIASENQVPLNKEFFCEFILPNIRLYPEVPEFLNELKELTNTKRFQAVDLKVHHFIVSAGLKDLVEQVFSEGLVTWTAGCRYEVIADESKPNEPESVPVFCMDETMKTRSLFEISKGSFDSKDKKVNTRVEAKSLWAPFDNIVYIGDGPTDIPALALTRDRGGTGIVVYDAEKDRGAIEKRLEPLRVGRRTDFITPADYSLDGELYKYIQGECLRICQRYEAESGV